MSLGKFALIDIETSGVDPATDSIIDIGYLQFDGTKLVKEFSSLVYFEGEISAFISKLTGITNKMIHSAPKWRESEDHLLELSGHPLLAHNSDFEKSFLARYFDRYDDKKKSRESYEDSLLYLGLLFPDIGSLSLEHFLQTFLIKEHEDHRGLEDSKDLLRVLLVATTIYKKKNGGGKHLVSLFKEYNFLDWWYAKFFMLSELEYSELATAIDFNLTGAVAKYLQEKRVDSESVSKITPTFTSESITALYKDELRLKKIFPNYVYREGQIQLSNRVGQALKNGVHALVQAPTGTGKTIGYLIPAALYALTEKNQVLISTATKALQKQAIDSDTPRLKKMLSLDDTFKVATLVGSNNHYCEAIFRRGKEEETLLFEIKKKFEDKYLDLFFDHLFYQNGERDSHNFLVNGTLPHVLRRKISDFFKFEKELAVDFRSCTGARCPLASNCSYQKGIKEAKDANLILGNHAIMFNWPKAIPRPLSIIVDEAHKIEGTSTDAFTRESSLKSLDELKSQLEHLQGIGSLFYLLAHFEVEVGPSTPKIEKIREESHKTAAMLGDQLIALPEIFEAFFKRRHRFTEYYWNEAPFERESLLKDSDGVLILRKLESVAFILENFVNTLLPFWAEIKDLELKAEGVTTAWTRFESFFTILSEECDLLKSLLKGSNDDGWVRSLKFHATQGVTYALYPLNIGEMVYKGLLEGTNSVVFTSATLSNATGDLGMKGIDWMTGHQFIPPQKRFKTPFLIPPLFDYKNRTEVYLVSDLPPISNERFVPEVLYHLLKIIRALEGKSLLLFSNKNRFEQAREILLTELPKSEIELFVQGMGNSVVEDFKKSGRGVLLGMELFGEGIDIPGAALEFLFVDKIPDMRQDLIVERRRDFFEKNYGNEFLEYFTAYRARSLAQKLGRLLRSETDRGAALIVDSRVKGWKGRSMEQFNRLLLPYELKRATLDEASEGILKFLVD